MSIFGVFTVFVIAVIGGLVGGLLASRLIILKIVRALEELADHLRGEFIAPKDIKHSTAAALERIRAEEARNRRGRG